MPEVDISHVERDATVEDFDHALGHSCPHCAGIRDIGPTDPRCSLAILIATAKGTTEAEKEGGRPTKRELRNSLRKAKNQRKFLQALTQLRRAS